MLKVDKIAPKWDFCENNFLPFYEVNHSILGYQIVDLFYVISRIYISKGDFK